MHCQRCTTHYPQAVWQCIAGDALPTAHKHCSSALQKVHCPLPPGSEAVHCTSSTAHYPQAVWQCTQEFHCPLRPSSVAVHCRTSSAHCPRAVRQCTAGVPLSTAHRR